MMGRTMTVVLDGPALEGDGLEEAVAVLVEAGKVSVNSLSGKLERIEVGMRVSVVSNVCVVTVEVRVVVVDEAAGTSIPGLRCDARC